MSKTTVTRRAAGRTRIPRWDRVLMHDIGLVKMFAAGRVLFCVPAGMAAGFAVSSAVGLPAIIGIMLGALPAFLTCFVVVDEKASRVALRSAALLVPFVLALFCSIALHEYRVLELVLIVLLLFVQFYASRFGTWIGDFGGGLFAAYLCGLLLPLPLATFPLLAAIFVVSMAATIAIRSIVFHPNAYRSLMRSRRAFLGWQTAVLGAAADVLSGDGDLRTLQRLRDRSHEAALIADGLLAKPGTGHSGDTAERLHTVLFDTEQAVDGLARAARELVESDAPAPVREAVAGAIDRVLTGGGRVGDEAARELVGRIDALADPSLSPSFVDAANRAALLLSDLAATSGEWAAVKRELPKTGVDVPFQSPVVLAGGRPVGAGPIVNDEIAGGGMSGPWSRVRVSPPLRTAIQAAVAVAIAEPLAYLLDGQRFYWAVIGVMVILAGTNSTHDRLRKVVSRGLGTVIGGVIGIALVAVLGTTHPWWTLVVVVVGLVGGMYGFARSYTLWVIGLVVVLCQVYAYSGQFSDSLILYRLAENLLGAIIAVGVSVVVLPVATGAMIRRAILRHLASVRAFLEAALASGSGPEAAARLRSASRAVDNATFQLESVLKPLVRFASGGGSRRDDEITTTLRGVAGTIRGIAYRGERHRPLTGDVAESIDTIVARMGSSITELSTAVAGRGGEAGRGGRRAVHRGRDAAEAPALVWTSSGDLISALDERLGNGSDAGGGSDAGLGGDSEDAALLSYRLHALLRIDEALAGFGVMHGMSVDWAPAASDLHVRRAALSAGRVRERFPVS